MKCPFCGAEADTLARGYGWICYLCYQALFGSLEERLGKKAPEEVLKRRFELRLGLMRFIMEEFLKSLEEG